MHILSALVLWENLANKVWLLIPRSDWSGLFSLRSPFTEETEPGFTEKTTIVGRSFAKRIYRSVRAFDSMLDSFSLPLPGFPQALEIMENLENHK